MNLPNRKIKFTSKKRVYIEYPDRRENKIYIKRQYGEIKKCVNCDNLLFMQDVQIKRKLPPLCNDCFGKRKFHPKYKERRKDKEGYIFIKIPTHPYSTKAGWVREHRLVMEKRIGRYLHRWEIAHHINEIKDDNRFENLELLENNSIHCRKYHHLKRNEKGQFLKKKIQNG